MFNKTINAEVKNLFGVCAGQNNFSEMNRPPSWNLGEMNEWKAVITPLGGYSLLRHFLLSPHRRKGRKRSLGLCLQAFAKSEWFSQQPKSQNPQSVHSRILHSAVTLPVLSRRRTQFHWFQGEWANRRCRGFKYFSSPAASQPLLHIKIMTAALALFHFLQNAAFSKRCNLFMGACRTAETWDEICGVTNKSDDSFLLPHSSWDYEA